MRKSMILLGFAAGLGACSQSNNAMSNEAAANTAAPQRPKPAYCFFKDSETKDWKAKVDKDGNVVVSGKAYREDSRYKALLSPALVSGSTAEVAPTISQNDTPYGAPANWWPVSETIPASQRVDAVIVKCGGETIATLSVLRKK